MRDNEIVDMINYYVYTMIRLNNGLAELCA